MKIAYEYNLLTQSDSLKNIDFVRFDIRDNSIIKKGIPLLFLPKNLSDNIYIKDAVVLYENSILKQENKSPLGLAFDDDGLIQSFLSKNNDISPIVEITKFALNITKDLYIAICIEELSPFGYDLTLGLFLLKTLEDMGVNNFLLSSGSQTFPPLFNRKKTAPKKGQDEFSSVNAEYSSAYWAKEYLKANLWVYGINPPKDLDFYGLVKKCDPKIDNL